MIGEHDMASVKNQEIKADIQPDEKTAASAVNNVEKIYRFERTCIYKGMYRQIGEIIHTAEEPNRHMKEITKSEEEASRINESGILPDPSERIKLKKRMEEIENQKRLLI